MNAPQTAPSTSPPSKLAKLFHPVRGLKISYLLLACTVAFFFGLYMRAASYEIPYWQLIAIACAVVLLQRLVANQRNPVIDPDIPSTHTGTNEPASAHPRVVEWERLLGYVEKYPDLYSETAAQTKLRRTTAERLRTKHHVDLADDPETAKEIIGKPLYDFLHHPVATCPTQAEFDYYLTQIEKI